MNIWIRYTSLRAIALATVLQLIAGCVTKVPLSDVDNGTVDTRLVGLWEGPKDGDDSVLLTVVPFDKHGYVLTYCTYSTEDGKIVKKGQQTWRAWLTRIGGKDFYTADVRTARSLLGPEADGLKNEQVYIVGTWALDGDKLKLTTLNVEKHEEIKAAATTEDLQKLVAAHLNDETFFKDFMTYNKVSTEKQKDALGVLEKFETKD